MKNLFIMHTQYNLILSAAVMSRNPDAENTLVLFSEFTLGEALRQRLEETFDRVYVVRDAFWASSSALEEVRHIRQCLKKVKALRGQHFDNVYMSQERIFDMVLWASVQKKTPKARCANIEEDAYYSINPLYNAEDFVYREDWRVKRRKLRFRLALLEYPYDYRDVHYCYGMSRAYHGANLLFPWLARREMRSKELREITASELETGIRQLYGQERIPLPASEKYLVFFFDLMNRYKNPANIRRIVETLMEDARKSGRTVLLKYHPRETEKFPPMQGCFEIPHLIPAEKVLLDLARQDVIVVGNATTSCVVAAKLGFRVASVCKLEFPANTKMHTIMDQMGIFCMEDASDMNAIF